MKPHIRLAYSLIIAGMGFYMFERFGLAVFKENVTELHIGSFVLSVLALAPVALIVAGCIVFILGRLRRRR